VLVPWLFEDFPHTYPAYLDLARFGYERIAAGRPLREANVI